MVSVRGVTKKFGQLTALDKVDFSINAGEFVFLTGASGSGKTTLLRLMIRELLPSSGQLLVNGVDYAKIKSRDLPKIRRNIGTVFQDYKLLPDLTVKENIALPLSVRGVSDTDISKAVRIAQEMVGLGKKTDLFPAQLSGGELQRVGLARAIVGKPLLLLADEPTGNLDPKTGRSIVKLIKEIHSVLKTTVIMATHNSEIVNNYHLRVITLDEGRLVKDSPKGKYED